MQLTKAEKDFWLRKALWTKRQLACFVCGLKPDVVHSSNQRRDIYVAEEEIGLAMIAEQLVYTVDQKADLADRMYRGEELFAPKDAIRWAHPIYPSFPFKHQARRGWPWGSYENDCLELLALAAEEFWAGKVMRDEERKREVVCRWLMDEHGASETLAQAIDKVLRGSAQIGEG